MVRTTWQYSTFMMHMPIASMAITDQAHPRASSALETSLLELCASNQKRRGILEAIIYHISKVCILFLLYSPIVQDMEFIQDSYTMTFGQSYR